MAERSKPDELSDEQVRILRAIEDGRFYVNHAGRYIIRGEARPNRRERERLFKRGLVTEAWGRRAQDGMKWKLSARGFAVLAAHSSTQGYESNKTLRETSGHPTEEARDA